MAAGRKIFPGPDVAVREPGLVQNVLRGGYLSDDVDDPAWSLAS